MSLANAVAGVLWFGVTLYALFGGADFGAGVWNLLAGGSERGAGPRELIDDTIGPVWEANHTWLIFDLVILWTAFPVAFSSVMTTLFIPLSLAALGIVLRGSGFAFGKMVSALPARRLLGATFAISSVLTPFFMGTVVGAIVSGRVPVGNEGGDPFTSWLNPTSILIGVLFVLTSAYLAAVWLVTDARREEKPELERYFAIRAVATASVAGIVAVAGLFVLHDEAPYVYDRLTSEALPLVLFSVACGLGVIVGLLRGVRRGTRVLASAAVVAVVWGWGLAQYPYLLPEKLDIVAAAANDASLTALVVVAAVALVLIGPSLLFLYTLSQRSLLEE